MIIDEITREVVFTDYHCAESARIDVVVLMRTGSPVALVRLGEHLLLHDLNEPDLLRSYAACLNAAADEMERMK